jgi:murein DD-endopeptidase MepM/ murein hydrolase activator NlpD
LGHDEDINLQLVMNTPQLLKSAAMATLAAVCVAGVVAQSSAIDVVVAARAIQPGELVVLTLTPPAGATITRVRAFDRDLSAYALDRGRWQMLVGIDLDATVGPHVVSIDATFGGRSNRRDFTLNVVPKTFPTRTLTVNDAFVNPPASAAERIAQDARDLAAIWAHPAGSRLWTGPFVRPVPHEANSAFGSRSVFNGQKRSPHAGADFLSPAGTPVKAPNSGRVVLARDLYYSGNTVIVDHGLGLFSLFAHFSAITVHEGDAVRTGDQLGLVGATGRVTGPHLHWAVNVNGARIDPLSLLASVK